MHRTYSSITVGTPHTTVDVVFQFMANFVPSGKTRRLNESSVCVGGGSGKKDTRQTKHCIFFLAVDQERVIL